MPKPRTGVSRESCSSHVDDILATHPPHRPTWDPRAKVHADRNESGGGANVQRWLGKQYSTALSPRRSFNLGTVCIWERVDTYVFCSLLSLLYIVLPGAILERTSLRRCFSVSALITR